MCSHLLGEVLILVLVRNLLEGLFEQGPVRLPSHSTTHIQFTVSVAAAATAVVVVVVVLAVSAVVVDVAVVFEWAPKTVTKYGSAHRPAKPKNTHAT